MPAFDLRGIKVAEYQNNNGAVTYGEPMSAGDAMNANLELRFAEGRLYAESSLAEYMKLATGGTVSLGVKYIPAAAQALMYGATATGAGSTPKGLKFTTKDIGKYVGVGFFAPDQIDGVTKYTCVFVNRALFGPPSMVYQTKGETLTFQTPTTTGEFLPDHAEAKNLIETAETDTEAAAIAWINSKFGVTE